MPRPSTLKPVTALGASRTHGTRLRYMAGCKCMICRAANSRYECERDRRRKQGLWNGLVSAKRTRKHLLYLSKMGVGRRSVAQRSRVSETIICLIKNGKRRQVRALTEKAILLVTKNDKRGSTLVDAASSWRKIDWMLSQGFTKTRIARELGMKTHALQLNKTRITITNARKISKLYIHYQ